MSGVESSYAWWRLAASVTLIDHHKTAIDDLIQLTSDIGQGYGIARPMPAERIPEWAASWSPPPSWVFMPR